MIVTLLVTLLMAATPDNVPYIYYYSFQHRAFVVERADGTDSRTFGVALRDDGPLSSVEGPGWSPDGQWIAFASTREAPGIFIMRPDGSDVRMVTNEPPFAEGGRESNNPVWRP